MPPGCSHYRSTPTGTLGKCQNRGFPGCGSPGKWRKRRFPRGFPLDFCFAIPFSQGFSPWLFASPSHLTRVFPLAFARSPHFARVSPLVFFLHHPRCRLLAILPGTTPPFPPSAVPPSCFLLPHLVPVSLSPSHSPLCHLHTLAPLPAPCLDDPRRLPKFAKNP